MKKFKTKTTNKGTTIVLEGVAEAIEVGRKCTAQQYANHYAMVSQKHNMHLKAMQKFEECIKAITSGDEEFKKKVDEAMEQLLGIIDEMFPMFSQQHSGYTPSEEGITSTADLLLSGDEKNTLARKPTPFELKRGSGEGAYRLVINTDVSWWGEPWMNCAICGALVVLLQRYAPAEIWIQQGWLGSNESDGVTLFKLDFTGGFEPTAVAFWITHKWKDSIFSYIINRSLGRKDYGTSCELEIEADIMLRGDWMKLFEFKKQKAIDDMTPFEQLDFMANWVGQTAMKILVEEEEGGKEGVE